MDVPIRRRPWLCKQSKSTRRSRAVSKKHVRRRFPADDQVVASIVESQAPALARALAIAPEPATTAVVAGSTGRSVPARLVEETVAPELGWLIRGNRLHRCFDRRQSLNVSFQALKLSIALTKVPQFGLCRINTFGEPPNSVFVRLIPATSSLSKSTFSH